MTVGEQLREARNSRGWSVQDVADQVKLRATIVSAIESDDLSLCGGDTYARGHIRAIAAALGLDGDVLVNELH
jgi:cytoskeleton protein RodZ